MKTQTQSQELKKALDVAVSGAHTAGSTFTVARCS